MKKTIDRASRKDQHFAFVGARWHGDIVARGRDAFLQHMGRAGVPADRIDLFEVPGAFEIPLHAKRLAVSGRYGAIVAGGFVVDGGIYRHEFVAQSVISGLMSVQLETGVPILSMVLTPQSFHGHAEHQAFFLDHFVRKGIEAAEACLAIVASLAALPKRVAQVAA